MYFSSFSTSSISSISMWTIGSKSLEVECSIEEEQIYFTLISTISDYLIGSLLNSASTTNNGSGPVYIGLLLSPNWDLDASN